ncbi:MAG: EamA family transporter RarD [Pseudomonadota bacterium]|jgi:chloramphenicol-sensitive protein RarD
MQQGVLYAASAYVLWGLFPLYFKLLQTVAPLEILAHRIVWSIGFLALLLGLKSHWQWLGAALRDRSVLQRFAASAALIACNWFIYIWAVTNGRVVDASLGYFIAPLANVLTGRLVLKERLSALQWAAVALAAAGVAWLTWQLGTLPWVALGLAASFSSYGYLRKTASLGALEGLTLETLLLAPLALLGLGLAASQGHSDFAAAALPLQLLLMAAGPLTAVPLLLFAAGARRIPMTVLGMLQYLGPTLQLMLGVWLYHEPFAGARAQGFVLIWLACVLFSADLVWRGRK